MNPVGATDVWNDTTAELLQNWELRSRRVSEGDGTEQWAVTAVGPRGRLTPAWESPGFNRSKLAELSVPKREQGGSCAAAVDPLPQAAPRPCDGFAESPQCTRRGSTSSHASSGSSHGIAL